MEKIEKTVVSAIAELMKSKEISNAGVTDVTVMEEYDEIEFNKGHAFYCISVRKIYAGRLR